MPRIETLTMRNLRSVGEQRVSIEFAESGALVLLGENNAGKSDITRALDILAWKDDGTNLPARLHAVDIFSSNHLATGKMKVLGSA